MISPDQEEIFKAKLSTAEFDKLSTFIQTEYGIKMPAAKKIMLQSRLQKRLRELNITTYKKYIDFVFSPEGKHQELLHMIDVVTTNKTDFFREATHFDYLANYILPEFIQGANTKKQLKIWSAGCSSGEEPYTMAMVLNDFANTNTLFDYFIWGTDISSRMLEKAAMAIYPEDRIIPVPLTMKRNYLLKSKDREKPTVRIVPTLRSKVFFKRLNFMDSTYDVHEIFDVVFCRNVLIYFDRENQEAIINKLCSKLRTNGYFFLGHSESIMNLNVPLKQVKPTIFKRI
jgi:chemotaxis protein methyltransferase CheR